MDSRTILTGKIGFKVLIYILICYSVKAQKTESTSRYCPVSQFCAHADGTVTPEMINKYVSDYHVYINSRYEISQDISNAQRIVDRILCLANSGSIEIKVNSSDCPNAVAVNCGDDKYIFFNTDYLTGVMATSDSSVIYGIFAHEVGHLIRGDAWLGGEFRHQAELNADQFAGRILGLLDFSIDLARATLNEVNEVQTSTHPPKTLRLTSIEMGWRQGARNLDTISIGTIAYIVNCKSDSISNPFAIYYETGPSKSKRSNYVSVKLNISGKQQDLITIKSITYFLHPYSFKSNSITLYRNSDLNIEIWGSFELRASIVCEIQGDRREYLLSRLIEIKNQKTGKLRKNEKIRPLPDIIYGENKTNSVKSLKQPSS